MADDVELNPGSCGFRKCPQCQQQVALKCTNYGLPFNSHKSTEAKRIQWNKEGKKMERSILKSLKLPATLPQIEYVIVKALSLIGNFAYSKQSFLDQYEQSFRHMKVAML